MSRALCWPRSLWGRHVLLTLGLVVGAELALGWGFFRYEQIPKLERTLAQGWGQAQLLGQAMQHMAAPERERFVASLGAVPEGASVVVQRQAPLPEVPKWWLIRRVLQTLPNPADGAPAWVWSSHPMPRVWQAVRVDDQTWWVGWDAQVLLPIRSGVLLAVLGVASVLAVAGAALIQRRLHQPLRQLQGAAEQVAEGAYPVHDWTHAPSEVAGLALAFNRMTQQLNSANEERALMLAGVSHDLRTPLAKLRLAVELLQVPQEEALLQGMARNIAVADQVIDQFIDFARVGVSEVPSLCEPQELVRDVVKGCGPERIRIDRLSQPLPLLQCRPLALRRALGNVLENALKYSEGRVAVGLERRGHMLHVVVQDHGPGIPEADLLRARQPFTRLQAGRGGPPGAGLGLAIVERVLRQEGGYLQMRNHQGLEVRLVLPLASQQV